MHVLPWQLEVIRFPSIGNEIALGLGVTPAPECRMEHGRTTLIFRRLGASRWSEEQQIDYAARAASVARAALANDHRRMVRRGARWATVIVYEDASVVQGCAVVARWQCVIPAGS